MSDASQREWRFYIDDMISFAEKVSAYTNALDKEKFVASGLNYDATIRNLELIGEAATMCPRQSESRMRKCPVATNYRHSQSLDSWLSWPR
jgi:uncharacterized protein with HEPN domain